MSFFYTNILNLIDLKQRSYIRLLYVSFACIILVVLINACNEPKFDQYIPKYTGRIMVVGHGGSGFNRINQGYAVNTISSIRKGIEGEGADGVELDVQFTADKVPLLYHGTDLSDYTNCGGPLCIHLSNDLNNCYYRHNIHSGSLLNDKLVNLDELIKLLTNYPSQLIYILEMKLNRDCMQPYEDIFEYADIVGQKLMDSQLTNQFIIESKDENFLIYLKKNYPQLKLFYYASGYEIGFSISLEHGFQGINLNHHRITALQVKEAQEAGLWVSLFGVRTYQDNIETIKKAPEIIVSDNITLTLGLIEGRL